MESGNCHQHKSIFICILAWIKTKWRRLYSCSSLALLSTITVAIWIFFCNTYLNLIAIFMGTYVVPFIDESKSTPVFWTFASSLFALTIQDDNCFSWTSCDSSELMSRRCAMAYDSVWEGRKEVKSCLPTFVRLHVLIPQNVPLCSCIWSCVEYCVFFIGLIVQLYITARHNWSDVEPGKKWAVGLLGGWVTDNFEPLLWSLHVKKLYPDFYLKLQY